nr:OmpA family protein [Saprospiraceae bacterium]
MRDKFLFLGVLFALYSGMVTSVLSAQEPIILDAENAIHLIEVTEVKKINEHGPAFSAIEYDNGLLWVSYERRTSQSRYLLSDKSIFELLWLPLEGDGEAPKKIDLLPGGEQQYGPVSLDKERNWVFFTASQQRAFRGKNQLGIYQKNKGETTKSQGLPFVRLEYNYAHPSWDGEKQRLYFSSDKGSSAGKMDLYYADYRAGTWSAPVKLEGNISSSDNDLFPYVTPHGLFFASDRPGGSGNLDLYFAPKDSVGFLPVKRLPAPFNSSGDDFGIWVNERGTGGYFSSTGEGRGGVDRVYRFQCPTSCFTPASVSKSLDIFTFSSSDQAPVRDAQIMLVPAELLTDLIAGADMDWDPLSNKLSLDILNQLGDEVEVLKGKTNREGKNLMTARTNRKKFLLFVTAEGYQSQFLRIDFEDGFSHVNKEVAMEADCKEIFIQVNSEEGEILPHAELEIRNQEDGERINPVPVEGGYSVCLPLNRQYVLEVKAEEKKDLQRYLFPKSTARDTLLLILESEVTEVVKEGTVLELENIYYEYNSHLISVDAQGELDELAKIMKADTAMVIELRAHTDSRGRPEYNLSLSQRRANSAMEYLVTQGIEASRIRTIGLGETQLRNQCSPGVVCSEEAHAYNRRTEVAVIRAGEGVRAVRDKDGLRFTIYED